MRATSSGAPGAMPTESSQMASFSGATRGGRGSLIGDSLTRASSSARLHGTEQEGDRRHSIHSQVVRHKEPSMSLVRFLPAWFHAIADYAVGITLIVVSLAVGGSGLAVATGVVVGAVVLVVSMLTRYPLGIAKVLPFTLHSGGDYLAAALLVFAPFVLGFSDTDGGLTAFYVVAGLAVAAVSLVTNYQYSPKREWAGEAVRVRAA
jgi:SPW repeat